jgi:predicted Na+-dependent transporter
MTLGRLLSRAAAPLPLVLVAAGAGIVAPSGQVARRSDAILAALVFTVAVTIEPSRLQEAFFQRWRIAVAVVLPFIVLLPLSLALGRAFENPERDALLALGLAPSEVAVAALVALAAGDAAFALVVVAFSLFASALLAPVVAPLFADSGVDAAELIVRFSFVVMIPLLAGLFLRARSRRAALSRYGESASIPILALLVYASLGELGTLSDLGAASLAALAFFGVSILAAVALRPVLGEFRTGGLVFSLRDFAVAATLAFQIGPAGAAVTPAVYGVLMLIVAAALAARLSRG